VIGDISSRRGQVGGSKVHGNTRIIDAQVPLAELSGYATAVRNITGGRASFYMEPSHYQELPRNIQENLAAKINGQEEKDN
jgi:elongation factor G